MNPGQRRRLGGGSGTVKAAHFDSGVGQFLNIADNAALSMGAGVHPTFVFWVYVESFANSSILSKDAGTAATVEYGFQARGTGAIRMNLSNGTTQTALDSAVVPLNRWTFVVGQYTGANALISVNNGAFASAVDSNDIQDSTNAFRIGIRSDGASAFTGAVSQLGIAKSILSAAELTELYNGGKGKSFALLSAGLAVKFSAYYDLDDAGGSGATWLDKAGTSHLTAGAGAAAPTAVVLRR